jgi:hypothetical protein
MKTKAVLQPGQKIVVMQELGPGTISWRVIMGPNLELPEVCSCCISVIDISIRYFFKMAALKFVRSVSTVKFALKIGINKIQVLKSFQAESGLEPR